MRALAACLSVVLGLAATTTLLGSLAGCSDSSDGGSGGASGSAAAAGGASGSAAAAGGNGGSCSFQSNACRSCLGTKCMDQFSACTTDDTCSAALAQLTPCVCGGTNTETCAQTFYTDGKAPAEKLTDCYTLNCTDACD